MSAPQQVYVVTYSEGEGELYGGIAGSFDAACVLAENVAADAAGTNLQWVERPFYNGEPGTFHEAKTSWGSICIALEDVFG